MTAHVAMNSAQVTCASSLGEGDTIPAQLLCLVQLMVGTVDQRGAIKVG